jgi:hypothetical protein
VGLFHRLWAAVLSLLLAPLALLLLVGALWLVRRAVVAHPHVVAAVVAAAIGLVILVRAFFRYLLMRITRGY